MAITGDRVIIGRLALFAITCDLAAAATNGHSIIFLVIFRGGSPHGLLACTWWSARRTL